MTDVRIDKLRLTQYRNYTSLDMRPGPGINAILGDNAQGKTNAAEAIFLCAFGRSHRTAKDSELIMHGCAGGYVGLDITNNTGSHLIELKLRDGERKRYTSTASRPPRPASLWGTSMW